MKPKWSVCVLKKFSSWTYCIIAEFLDFLHASHQSFPPAAKRWGSWGVQGWVQRQSEASLGHTSQTWIFLPPFILDPQPRAIPKHKYRKIMYFFNIYFYLFGCTGSYLWHAGWDLVEACRIFSCGMGTLVCMWGLGPLHWEHRVLATGPPRKFPEIIFLNWQDCI